MYEIIDIDYEERQTSIDFIDEEVANRIFNDKIISILEDNNNHTTNVEMYNNKELNIKRGVLFYSNGDYIREIMLRKAKED